MEFVSMVASFHDVPRRTVQEVEIEILVVSVLVDSHRIVTEGGLWKIRARRRILERSTQVQLEDSLGIRFDRDGRGNFC